MTVTEPSGERTERVTFRVVARQSCDSTEVEAPVVEHDGIPDTLTAEDAKACAAALLVAAVTLAELNAAGGAR